jgi:hypothetical protein
LFYTGGNKILFKVFPFAANETRKTGISFIHKDPVTLNIEGDAILLGKNTQSKAASVNSGGVAYVSAKEKTQLKKLRRIPYYHFIADVSVNAKNQQKHHIATIKKVTLNVSGMGKPKVSFANTYTTTATKNWESTYIKQSYQGGFYAGHAIKKILTDTYNHQSVYYPVIVLVTDSLQDAVIDNNFADYKFMYPDQEHVFSLNSKGNLVAHSMISSFQDTLDLKKPNISNEVLAWPKTGLTKRYLKNDNQPEIILTGNPLTTANKAFNAYSWDSGLLLQGEYMLQTLRPETSGAVWQNQVSHSVSTKIMSPFTSYIVLENQAQKEVLKNKQSDVLLADKTFDADEVATPIPYLWLWATMLLGIILAWFKQNRFDREN